ncbi:hypothetical protein SDC9_119237 [bioreactor metagenome]|uniref:Uncharacterized protein n=1 Tax=bioreactor metagenome TaxID=1076179 RepID=A0A645C9D2_9ZZZZ
MVAGSLAAHTRNHRFNRLRTHAHNFSNSFHRFFTAGRTGVCPRIPADNRLCIGIASGITAGAAVCSRNGRANRAHALVHLDGELFIGNAKHEPKKNTEPAEGKYGV